ncbi:MAG TPA: flagellar hook-length control protein FliK [Terriglobales bacterium]
MPYIEVPRHATASGHNEPQIPEISSAAQSLTAEASTASQAVPPLSKIDREPLESTPATAVSAAAAPLPPDHRTGDTPLIEPRSAEGAAVRETVAPVSPFAPVHEARLLARTDLSEMHIGLQTTAFGTVEVHAVVRESQVGISIGSERGELHKLMTNEMPALSVRLQEHDLRLDQVRFFDQGPRFDAGSGSGSDGRASSFEQQRTAVLGALRPREPTADIGKSEILMERTAGLNVHA